MSSVSIGRDAEWELREYLQGLGFMVIRSAASRIVDLIAIRVQHPHDQLFIEVKSTMDDAFKVSRVRSNKEQIRDLNLYAELIEAFPIYAVKFRPNRGWVVQDARLLPPVIRSTEAKPLTDWAFEAFAD